MGNELYQKDRGGYFLTYISQKSVEENTFANTHEPCKPLPSGPNGYIGSRVVTVNVSSGFPPSSLRITAGCVDTGLMTEPFPVPTLSADHPLYDPSGGYWRGSVWAPMSWLFLFSARRAPSGKTTIPKNRRREIQREKFIGWTGLPVISLVLEYIFGLKPGSRSDHLFWNIELEKDFSVERYPVGFDGSASYSME